MSSSDLKPTNVTSASSPSSYAGHAKQEAREFIDEIKSSNAKAPWMFAPAPTNATGFRLTRISPSHADNGFLIDKQSVEKPAIPNAALLDALSAVRDRRLTFVPEVYSATLGRNVRFAVNLPAGFDPTRAMKYFVVVLVPREPPGPTLAAELLRNDLIAKAERELGKDAKEVIFVMPERLEHRPDVVDADVLDRRASMISKQFVESYVAKSFNAESDVFAYLKVPTFRELSAPTAQAPVAEDKRKPEGTSSSADVKSGPGGNFFSAIGDLFMAPVRAVTESFKSIVDELASTASPVLVQPNSTAKVMSATDADAWKAVLDPKDTVRLPSTSTLEKLAKHDKPVMMLGSTKTSVFDRSVPYAVIAPAGFEPEKAARLKVRVLLAPEGSSGTTVARELATRGLPDAKDTLFIVAPCTTAKSDEAGEREQRSLHVALVDVAAELASRSVAMNLIDVTLVQLEGSAQAWTQQAVTAAGDHVLVPGPVVSTADGWVRVAESSDHKKEFPAAGKVGGTDKIPTSLQKQEADSGSFFVPSIDSAALGKRARFGVYLPPGYDPASAERYPVLFMLPGRGNPLHYWTSAGGLVERLDRMMAGDAQKMIVVIPDNTDSFFFDYSKWGPKAGKAKGKPSEDAPNYEAFVMDELKRYATTELLGDSAKLAIGGISRGAFGAVSMAIRNPGVFKSVSSHSGMIAHDHVGFLSEMAVHGKDHLGDSGDPAWKALNPSDLVAAGAWDNDPPRIFIDVGADDQYATRQACVMADVLEQRGVPHFFGVLDHTDKKVEYKHTWDTWAKQLETWIGFHQTAFGKAGKPKLDAGMVNAGKGALEEFRDAEKKRWGKVDGTMKELVETAALVAHLGPDLQAKFGGMRLYDGNGGSYAVDFRRDIERAPDIVAGTRAIVDARKTTPIHVVEKSVERAVDELDRIASNMKRASESLVGAVPRPAAPDRTAFARLDKVDREDLLEVIRVVPHAEDAIVRLATMRPQVFGSDDPLTGSRFAKVLKQHVKNDKVFDVDKDGRGFVEFLERMATRRFDWRRGGYSHVVCSSMNLAFNHPGVVVALVQTSRLKETYDAPKRVFEGNGKHSIKPHDDLIAGWRSVGSTAGLPAAELGYERGLLRAVKDELGAENSSRLPDERFGSTCQPVAIGLTRLSAQDVDYGYAYKLKTGDDLVEALATQGGEGLAMGDVTMRVKGEPHALHFPVFYDYDPKTRTVAMQEWTRGEARFSVDEIRFDKVSCYFRHHPGMKKFLTPDEQSNWEKIRPDRHEIEAKRKAEAEAREAARKAEAAAREAERKAEADARRDVTASGHKTKPSGEPTANEPKSGGTFRAYERPTTGGGVRIPGVTITGFSGSAGMSAEEEEAIRSYLLGNLFEGRK